MKTRRTLLLSIALLCFPLFCQSQSGEDESYLAWGNSHEVDSLNKISTLHRFFSRDSLHYSVTLESTNHLSLEDVHQDIDGNVYACGFFSELLVITLSCDSVITMQSKGKRDGFYLKYKVTGTLEWIKQIGNQSDDILNAIAVDEDTNVILAGKFRESTQIQHSKGSAMITGPEKVHVFMVKLDKEGALVWKKLISDTRMHYPILLSVHNNGNISIKSKCVYYLDYMHKNAEIPHFNSTNHTKQYLIQLRPDGSYKWAKTFHDIRISDMCNSQNNLVVCGKYKYPKYPAKVGKSVGEYDGFISCLDASGKIIWDVAIGSPKSDGVDEVNVDANGDILVSGSFHDSIRIKSKDDIFWYYPKDYKKYFEAKINAYGSFIYLGSSEKPCARITTKETACLRLTPAHHYSALSIKHSPTNTGYFKHPHICVIPFEYHLFDTPEIPALEIDTTPPNPNIGHNLFAYSSARLPIEEEAYFGTKWEIGGSYGFLYKRFELNLGLSVHFGIPPKTLYYGMGIDTLTSYKGRFGASQYLEIGFYPLLGPRTSLKLLGGIALESHHYSFIDFMYSEKDPKPRITAPSYFVGTRFGFPYFNRPERMALQLKYHYIPYSDYGIKSAPKSFISIGLCVGVIGFRNSFGESIL